MSVTTTSDVESKSATWRGQGLGWLVLGTLLFFTWLPSSYYRMIAWGWIVAWQVGFFLLGVWAIWMLRQFHQPFRWLGYGLDWAVGLGVVTLVLSSVFAEFPRLAAWNISIAINYIVLLYVLRNWLGYGGLTLKRSWVGLAFVGVVTNIISMVIWFPKFLAGQTRNDIPFGHPNFVAGYVLLVFPIVLALGLSERGWRRVVGILASIFLIYVLYTTGSRGGFVGFLALVLVSLIFWVAQSKGLQRQRRLLVCLVGLGATVVLLISNPRVQQIVQIPGLVPEVETLTLRVDGQTQDRLFMWEAGFNILRDRPFFGVGAGNMARVYNLYRPLEAGVGAATVQQLHNTPLQILGELGLTTFLACLAFLFLLSRLWFKLYCQLRSTQDRLLLYGAGGGIFAYGVSSLTDYQLENIGISNTLVMLLVLLTGLADQSLFSASSTIKRFQRRLLSLGGIGVLALVAVLWLQMTIAMASGWRSYYAAQAGDVTKAYENSSFAANLVPWDPVFNLLAGFQVLKTKEKVKDPELANELNELAIQHFQEAVTFAPYDAYFNHNLGVLYASEPPQAETYLSRSVQLNPRNTTYTYYLLGLSYLRQGETEKAVTAWALQGLIEPQFLLSRIWEDSLFAPLQDQVVEANFAYWEKLLARMSPQHIDYQDVYNRYAFLRWWYSQPIENPQEEVLYPVTKALLVAESAPQRALEILEAATATPETLLLQAWLQPEQKLAVYIETSGIAEQEQKLLKEVTEERRELRDWLISLKRDTIRHFQKAIYLAYRNIIADQVNDIFMPPEVRMNRVVELLEIWDSYEREFPELDQLLSTINEEKLGLPYPTQNNHQL